MMDYSSPSMHTEVIQCYLESLDCPRALTVWILYKESEHVQLAHLDWEPSSYNCKISAQDSLAATKFLSKATFLESKIDKKEVALKKFRVAEQICSRTNTVLRRGKLTPLTCEIIEIARRKIERVLGPVRDVGSEQGPSTETPSQAFAEEWIECCNWGPGATTALRRRFASAPNKYDVERCITADLYEFVCPWFASAYPNFRLDAFETIKGNKIITVPKNSKTDRTIAIEPGWNLWFQKGLGAMIRRRLQRVGIDLDDQRKNQKLARLGSKFDHLATIDFSAASDTIAIETVRELLPADWFLLLDCCRSKVGSISKESFYYSKFSSMGNGFTFELESLIFWALAKACAEKMDLQDAVSVYGDDVILPSLAVPMYEHVVHELGFSVNSEKSYTVGPFRESCGSYYWNGVCIKPIFLKDPLKDERTLLKFCNALRLLAHRRNVNYGCDRRLQSCHSLVFDHLKHKFPVIPHDLGDIGLIGNPDESTTWCRPKGQHQGFIIKIVAVLASQIELETHGVLLHRLKSMGSADIGYGNTVPFPERLRVLRKKILVSKWSDLGDWL